MRKEDKKNKKKEGTRIERREMTNGGKDKEGEREREIEREIENGREKIPLGSYILVRISCDSKLWC